jgi:hypothetical protein
MSDEMTGAASAAGGESIGFLGGLPPAPIEQDQTEQPEQPKQDEPKAEEAKPAEGKPDPAKESLAALIRKQREDRQAREVEAKRAKDNESKLAEAQSEIDKLKRTSAEFEADPVAYAKAHGWSKEKQALMGQMLLYDLVPEKATPEIRQRLFELRQEQKERERVAKDDQAAKERAQAAEKAQYEAFVGTVDQAVRAFPAGSHPESEDWFGDDHDTYVKSLVATALNLIKAGSAAGQAADLSPANLARVLETEVARKMKVRDERRSKREPVTPEEQKAGAMSGSVGGGLPVDSTKGTTVRGAPLPKAKTDQERLARAVAVAFKAPGTR